MTPCPKSRHLAHLFASIREQFRDSDTARAHVVGGYAELAETQEDMDRLFSRIGVGTYRSLLRPIAASDLAELCAEVSCT